MLDFSGCAIGFHGGGVLAETLPSNSSLLRFDLDFNQLGRSNLFAIQDVLQRNEVTYRARRAQESLEVELICSDEFHQFILIAYLSPSVYQRRSFTGSEMKHQQLLLERCLSWKLA